MHVFRRLIALVAGLALTGSVAAQDEFSFDTFPVPGSPGSAGVLLFINQEQILLGSQPGRAILQRERDEEEALNAEGIALVRELEAEELDLTRRRDTLPPEQFRELADAFDARVVEIRAQQLEKDRAQVARNQERRRAFYTQAARLMAELMRARGAAAVLDHRTVLLFDTGLDITQDVIERLDATHAAIPDFFELD